MDPMIFLDLANELTKLKMYPYFDLAHFIVTGLYLRDDLSTGIEKNFLSSIILFVAREPSNNLIFIRSIS